MERNLQLARFWNIIEFGAEQSVSVVILVSSEADINQSQNQNNNDENESNPCDQFRPPVVEPASVRFRGLHGKEERADGLVVPFDDDLICPVLGDVGHRKTC